MAPSSRGSRTSLCVWLAVPTPSFIDVIPASDPRVGPGVICSVDTDGTVLDDDIVTIFVGNDADHTVAGFTLLVSRFYARGRTSWHVPLGLLDAPYGSFVFDDAAYIGVNGDACSINCYLHHVGGSLVVSGFRDNLLWYPLGDPLSIARYLVGATDLASILAAVTHTFPSSA